jgi:hypothetical protein
MLEFNKSYLIVLIDDPSAEFSHSYYAYGRFITVAERFKDRYKLEELDEFIPRHRDFCYFMVEAYDARMTNILFEYYLPINQMYNKEIVVEDVVRLIKFFGSPNLKFVNE